MIKGKNIPRNLDKAKELLEKYLKNKKSIYSLLYGKIKKKEEKYEEAKSFFEQSISEGNGDAMFEYGKLLFKGKGIDINKEEVIQYYIKAINNNNCTNAMNKYGHLLMKGEGVELNKEEGIKYIKMAADNGNVDASCECGEILHNDNKDDHAIKYFKMAAEKGYVDGINDYATLLATWQSSNL